LFVLPQEEAQLFVADVAELLDANGIRLADLSPGRHYAICPRCSAQRSNAHRKLKCLGVTIEPDGVFWGCNHCSWTGPKPNGGGPQLPAYVYRDINGVERFRKVRNAPGRPGPRFWLEQRDGSGWRKGTKGVDTSILYRADEIAKATAAGRFVCIVEGEKDADNLWRLGFAATCNAHGASEMGKAPKWTAKHSAQLRDADIVVLGDEDSAGYAHADMTCQLSIGVAKRVRRLILKEHWPEIEPSNDVSDWLAAGHTGEELQALVDDAPDYDGGGPPPPPPGDEIERLSRLSPLDFAREKKEAAKRLGVNVADLTKAVEAKRRARQEKPGEADAILAELNRDNSVVMIGARCRVLRFEDVPHVAGGEHYIYRLPTYVRPEDFINYYLNRTTITALGPVSIGKWWFEQPRRQQYRGVVFLPGGPPIVDGDYFNLWTGFAIEAKRGDWSLMQTHIFEVLAAGDQAFYDYTLNWLAYVVQHPDRQAEVALVFIGGQGTGKGVLGRAMCKIFGQHARHVSHPDHLGGKFNAHLQQCAFLFADEAVAPADKKAEGTIKRLITEPTLHIEPKGVDPFEVPNRLSVMMASNHDQAIAAGEKERRYAAQRVAENRQQSEAWFAPLYKEMRNDGLEAMLARPLGDWHPRQIVRTATLGQQQEESLSPLDAWWFELLQTGVLTGADATPNTAISNSYEEEIEEEEVTEGHGIFSGKQTRKRTRMVVRPGLYDQARRISPKLKSVEDAAFGRYLGKQGGARAWVKRKRGWCFPSLAHCRDKWLERFPHTIWPEASPPDWTFGEDDE
jgi:hypothetical protein